MANDKTIRNTWMGSRKPGDGDPEEVKMGMKQMG
jgi:hypothetical protein